MYALLLRHAGSGAKGERTFVEIWSAPDMQCVLSVLSRVPAKAHERVWKV
eukprot:COSAG02_NODE_38938_length_423_cov_0.638889_1_plen_49_part_10